MKNVKNDVVLDIYDHGKYGSSYKKWIEWQLDFGVRGGRGSRKHLALHVGCQISHIANVLNDDAHFSLEQAERVGDYFELSGSEIEFLLLMVQWNRAGTKTLRDIYEAQIVRTVERVAESRRNLKERIPIRRALEREHEAVYYSSWQYPAVHVLLSIPTLQTAEALAGALSVARERVEVVLEFLCQSGLAVFEDGHYRIGPQHLHLAIDSPFIARHHVNWRTRVSNRLESVGTIRKDDLHYSSVLTVSESDFDQVREILTSALAKAIDVVKASPEETGAILNIDWMHL